MAAASWGSQWQAWTEGMQSRLSSTAQQWSADLTAASKNWKPPDLSKGLGMLVAAGSVGSSEGPIPLPVRLGVMHACMHGHAFNPRSHPCPNQTPAMPQSRPNLQARRWMGACSTPPPTLSSPMGHTPSPLCPPPVCMH